MRLNGKTVCLAVIAALAVLSASSCGWFGNDGANEISLSGNIELTETNIAFKTPGLLVELTVDEGDDVKKDQVVARLDRAQLLSQRDRVQAALRAAESQTRELQTAIQFQSETVEGQIAGRRAELDQAEANLKQLLAGSRSQDIEQARAQVERARSEFEQARSDWERAQALYKTGDISEQQHQQNKTRFEAAAASLKQAEERFALVKEGPRKEDIEAARALVARAQAGLRLAGATRLEVKQKQQRLETARAEVERARSEVALIETQLKETEAVSPIDGVVLVKAAEAGEVVAAGTTILTVGDLARPWLRGYIQETDLGRVKLGDKVRVTTDSFPGKVYEGRISFISSEAEFTPKQIQTQEERVKLVYRIKIDIENPARELKSNMPADAVIVLGER
ncbi:MAG: efflux RND transporter periplasmic adaptor subunit [Blastocatellia bacterium]|nr:efflux RND transporter periplasmic adaptor subunit [Blastocatellia bacterium]